MHIDMSYWRRPRICETQEVERYLNPNDINIAPGFRIEVAAQGLDAPSCMEFNEEGDMFIGLSGFISNKPEVLRYKNGHFEMIADGFDAPLSGLCCHKDNIYVSHKGKVTILDPMGNKTNIIVGLPSQGDHWNSNVVYGADDKIYFGQGTATNSGVVGSDNTWVHTYPFVCDYPGSYIMLYGQNFETRNILNTNKDLVRTGAFSPYGVPNLRFEVRKGILKASGSILRADPDGSNLELVAWGFRFPTYIRFDSLNRLFASNQGYDSRGSRPIANASDEFQLVKEGLWYGWPDYSAGESVSSNKFKPEGGTIPEQLITSHPNQPPHPYAEFQPNSYIVGFDFCNNKEIGTIGDAYIAEFGMGGRLPDHGITPYAGKGHRVSKIDMKTGIVTTFAINKSGFSASVTGGGGLSRPVDVKFAPDGTMYILDMGINALDNLSYYYPNTGVLWRVTRTG